MHKLRTKKKKKHTFCFFYLWLTFNDPTIIVVVISSILHSLLLLLFAIQFIWMSSKIFQIHENLYFCPLRPVRNMNEVTFNNLKVGSPWNGVDPHSEICSPLSIRFVDIMKSFSLETGSNSTLFFPYFNFLFLDVVSVQSFSFLLLLPRFCFKA